MEKFTNNSLRKGQATPEEVSLGGNGPFVSGSSSSASMEAVLDRLSRLEARFSGGDDRGGVHQRPDPDPPYGMPPGWKAPTWVPGGPPTSGLEGKQPKGSSFAPSPNMHGGQDSRVCGGNQQSLGFRQTPTNPITQPSTWDLGPVRSTWEHPAHRSGPQYTGSDPSRMFKVEPQIFDGSEAQNWVTRFQYYFDHIMIPEEHRLHYVVMLFAPTVTDWIFSYRAGNPAVSWSQFLDDVRRRFDPHYFVNYVELISKLTQMGPLADYNRQFERMKSQIQGVSKSTLLAMYLSGLRHPLRNQVRFQHPLSIASAVALAVEFDVGSERSTPQHRPWQPRDTRAPGTA